MKSFIPFLFFVLLVQQMAAQKEASIWYFGHNAGLDFNTGAPVLLTDGSLYTDEGCASISDANGNILFYTDGITVWNRNHNPMPNGNGLKGDPSSTQSAIIVPKSNEPNIYYVFTVDNIAGPDGLQYNVVDMNLDGGLGDVTTQKNIVLQSPVSEKITAIENTNGNGVWVVTKGFQNNTYYSYLVDGNGVNVTPVVSDIGFTVDGVLGATIVQETHGYLKASPDGRFLASAISGQGKAELCRFNAASGVVTDFISLQDFFDDEWYDDEPYGVEFSPNNSVLYMTTKGGVYQFDISTYDEATILASGIRVSPLYGLPPFPMAIQMGIDGKLYVVHSFRRYLMVINDPDVLGPGCNFVEQGVSLGSVVRSGLGLPPFITSFFDVGIETENFCLGDGTEFSIDSSEPITNINWNFGDSNTSTLETPTHTYLAPGDYTVNVTVTTATSTTSDTTTITIYEMPVANTVTNFEVCTISTNQPFDLSTKNGEVLDLQSDTDFQVIYFSELIDAQNNTNALPNIYSNTLPIETVYARVQNVANPDCFDTTNFDLVVQQAPIINAQNDWTVCDTDMDGFFTFDLSQKTISILTGNNTADFLVSYHLSQADVDANTNPIPMDYTNTVPREEIFWRIENNTYPTCYGQGTFFLEVISGVTANTPIDFVVCDDNNDGIFVFDLSTKETEILGTQNAASVNITFHSTLLAAENGTNPYSTNYTNTEPYVETVFARLENNADTACYDTTSFDLVISDSPIQQTVGGWEVCDTNNDGRFDFDFREKDSEILGNQPASDFSITYHVNEVDALAGQNLILGNFQNTSNPQQIFYRLESSLNPSCFVSNSFEVEVFDTPIANTATLIMVCDTDETGIRTFDLSVKDSEVLGGQNASLFEVLYFSSEIDATNNQNVLPKNSYSNTTLNETIYTRVQHMDNISCYAISNFQIMVQPIPQPNLQETYVICPDSPDLTIDGGDFESWSWVDENDVPIGNERTLVIRELGSYSLTVSQTVNGITCEKIVSFTVVSSGAIEDFTTDTNGFSDLVTIVVNTIGEGVFEYSTDGENFQESNRVVVFPGVHTIYVRDQYLCRTISKEIIALGYQKFFTPNGDGTNDFWNVIGADYYPESKLYIYDRYGKFIKQISPNNLGWDGTFNGVRLPSSDYWFRYFYDNEKIFSGHFSLKR